MVLISWIKFKLIENYNNPSTISKFEVIKCVTIPTKLINPKLINYLYFNIGYNSDIYVSIPLLHTISMQQK